MRLSNAMLRCLWLVLVIRIPAIAHGTEAGARNRERDVAYGEAPEQRLDLSLPAGEGFPTVIFVHGGSLVEGDKADGDYRDVCSPFVVAGIACANINYRLGPASTWPAQPQDVAAAVAWIRQAIGARGGDPQGLYLMGHSSGALLAALVGTDESYLARHGLKITDLRGVIPMGSIMENVEFQQALKEHGRESVEKAFARDPSNAVFGNLDTYLGLWPVHHVRRGQPPFLFLIAEAEQEHPPVLATNKRFVEEARAMGNQASFEVLPGRTHMTAIRRLGEPQDPAFARILEFIRKRGGPK